MSTHGVGLSDSVGDGVEPSQNSYAHDGQLPGAAPQPSQHTSSVGHAIVLVASESCSTATNAVVVPSSALLSQLGRVDNEQVVPLGQHPRKQTGVNG